MIFKKNTLKKQMEWLECGGLWKWWMSWMIEMENEWKTNILIWKEKNERIDFCQPFYKSHFTSTIQTQ